MIVRALVKGKLIKGSSGKGGGYVLCRAPESYTVGEILDWTEGSMAVVSCLADGAEVCPRADGCRTLPMWSELEQLIRDYLNGKKLSDLVIPDEQAC